MAKAKKVQTVQSEGEWSNLEQVFANGGAKFPFTVYFTGTGADALELNVISREGEGAKARWITSNKMSDGAGADHDVIIEAALAARPMFTALKPKSRDEQELDNLRVAVKHINEAINGAKRLFAQFGHIVRLENDLGIQENLPDLSSLQLVIDEPYGRFRSESGAFVSICDRTSFLNGTKVSTSELDFVLRELVINGKPEVKVGDKLSLSSSRNGILNSDGFLLFTWTEAEDVISFMEANRRSRKLSTLKAANSDDGSSAAPEGKSEGK